MDRQRMVERLYAPWREEFILGPKADECIFCDPDHSPKVRELIVHKGQRAYIVMNRYPYNSGHLLIVPYRHVARLENLQVAERNELMSLSALSSEVLNTLQQPAGLNMGMNLGNAAGAGIADHLHMHIVPRWVGDTNFLSAVSNTRIVSVDLSKLHRRFCAAFRKATGRKRAR